MNNEMLKDYICDSDISREYSKRNRVINSRQKLQHTVISVDRLINQAVLLGNSSISINIYNRDVLVQLDEFLRHRGYVTKIKKDMLTIDWS